MAVALILHNIRSSYNVGSILRTADGLGAERVYLTGYTPYPNAKKDIRPPHIANKVDSRIKKTALGAEKTQPWAYFEDAAALIGRLKHRGYQVVALEQTKQAGNIKDFRASFKVALIVGSEIGGVDSSLLDLADAHVLIPMSGEKDSLNVSVAAAIALYSLADDFKLV